MANVDGFRLSHPSPCASFTMGDMGGVKGGGRGWGGKGRPGWVQAKLPQPGWLPHARGQTRQAPVLQVPGAAPWRHSLLQPLAAQ